jgi:hypothetical protein
MIKILKEIDVRLANSFVPELIVLSVPVLMWVLGGLIINSL